MTSDEMIMALVALAARMQMVRDAQHKRWLQFFAALSDALRCVDGEVPPDELMPVGANRLRSILSRAADLEYELTGDAEEIGQLFEKLGWDRSDEPAPPDWGDG